MTRQQDRTPLSDDEIRAATLGELEPHAVTTKDWKYVQNCADARTAVPTEINERARRS